jgi:outer membrane protein OmpA-like peptidoglycan-associated protein
MAALLAATIGVAACSAVPDAVNPVSWYHGVEGWFESDEDQQARDQARAAEQTTPPLPGADRPYPNLSTVPERPTSVSTPADRNRVSQGLAADRENARYAQPEPERPAGSALGAPTAAPRTPVTRQTVPPRAAPSPDGLDQLEPPPSVPRSSLEDSSPPLASASPEPMEEASFQQASFQPAPTPQPAAMPASPPVLHAQAAESAAPALPVEVAETAAPARVADNDSVVQQAYEAALTQSDRPATAPAATPAATSARNGQIVPRAYIVHFSGGSAQLAAVDRALLRDVARVYKSQGGPLRIVGHSSSRTREADPVTQQIVNFRLSTQRAEAVARELARLGVPRNNMAVAAVSDSEPVYRESMPSGEAGNRRVEISFGL